MKKRKIRLYGWEAKIDKDKINDFIFYTFDDEIGRNYELNRYYIEHGDYVSKFPFGLLSYNEEQILFTLEKLDYIIIGGKPIKVHLANFKNWNGEGIELFFFTSIINHLTNNGFTPPINIIDFKGKPKGKISNRNKIIDSEKIVYGGIRFDINIIKSHKFTPINTGNWEAQIFYEPRYEIFEKELQITFTRDLLKISDEKIKSFSRTYERIEKNYIEIDQIIQELDKNGIFLKKISVIPEKQISYFDPPLFFSLLTLKQNQHNFQELNDILDDLAKGEKLNLILDENIRLDDDIIKQFKEYLSNRFGLKIKIRPFNSYSGNSNFSNSLNLCIINDKLKGTSFRYKEMKDVPVPNKVVKYSTIFLESPSWDNLAIILLLSLKWRKEKKLLLKKHDTFVNNHVSFILKPYLGGTIIELKGISLCKEKINDASKFYYNERNKELPPIEDITNLFQKLISGCDIKTETVITINDEINLLPKIKKIARNRQIILVKVKVLPTIMLEIKNKSIPRDGTFISISDKKYVLLTNGLPFVQFQGFPQPLYLEFLSNIDHYKEIEVLKEIYYLTFVHPFSLTKPKLPFHMHYLLNNWDGEET